MAEARVERRLAAILAADVAGYSRLMGVDEEGTLEALKACRRELTDPKIAEHHGRIVKTTGDGVLVEFASVIDAVRCAVDIQRAMAEHNVAIPKDRRIEFRIGINVGDVIIEKEDIYGDGVNIAARLEGIAQAGGICISRQAFDQIDGKLQLAVREMGPQKLKNITKPIEVFAIETDEPGESPSQSKPNQEIKYCRTSDGVRLAYATAGSGPILVKTGNWLNHLEYDWESPVWRHLILGLAGNHTLIRYDARGNGLSAGKFLSYQ
jgi:class 3 adenylate cyclase